LRFCLKALSSTPVHPVGTRQIRPPQLQLYEFTIDLISTLFSVTGQNTSQDSRIGVCTVGTVQTCKVDSSCQKLLSLYNRTFMALVIWNYFQTVLIRKIFNPDYDFLVPLCLYLVQKYWKNAVTNDKWFFATWVKFKW
jgi:hypothetical protein